jgi:hypothetical protein
MAKDDVRKNSMDSEVPAKWGFLLEEHPQLPTAVRVREFIPVDDNCVALPWQWCYSTTGDPLPWHADIRSGMFGHGITGYFCQQTDGDIPARLRMGIDMGKVKFTTHQWVVETTGILRYLFALLSTLNDVPTIKTQVRPSKGFVARGQYRSSSSTIAMARRRSYRQPG